MPPAVVIPVKDDPRVLDTVASIRSAAGGEAAEIVVVDNESSPDFQTVLDELRQSGCTVIQISGTVYTARNAGVATSSGDPIFFTDADCTVDPGWLEVGQNLLAGCLDLAQGLSGSLGQSWSDALIQARYQAHFQRLCPGEPLLLDTRNAAVRRYVFKALRFNEAFRRVGDSEFGLHAEAIGFRLGYAPQMSVRHAHDTLDVFVAKQICHGWGAQRLMHDAPGLSWHGGHLILATRWGPRLRRLRGHALAGHTLARATVGGARILDRAGPRLPLPLDLHALALLDKLAGFAGHLIYEPGTPEPTPSQFLARKLPRD